MKKRIDDIAHLAQRCTGCMACVDICPKSCISGIVGKDGFRYTVIRTDDCINCGKCYSVCPIETHKKHTEEQTLYAAYQKNPDGVNKGSSGGIFELLAKHCIEEGYYVCGAAFDETTLRHRIVKCNDEINPLLKSKYIQSDTEGIYNKVIELLKDGERVLFCGTPCQVSALINCCPASLSDGLVTADIICHGVPSQKTFDMYIESLEKKQGGKIFEFSFRVKDNRYKHAHGYSYKVEKNGKIKTVSGIYTNSSFYNAFKNYSIFRNGCYDCQYTTLNRVSDITLADFWGIEKYDFKANADSGVSMIITNSEKGERLFGAVRDKTVNKQFPIQYGIDSNHCLTNTTKKPKNRDKIIEELSENGYESTAKKYFGSSFVHRVYWLIPPFARNLIRKVR